MKVLFNLIAALCMVVLPFSNPCHCSFSLICDCACALPPEDADDHRDPDAAAPAANGAVSDDSCPCCKGVGSSSADSDALADVTDDQAPADASHAAKCRGCKGKDKPQRQASPLTERFQVKCPVSELSPGRWLRGPPLAGHGAETVSFVVSATLERQIPLQQCAPDRAQSPPALRCIATVVLRM